jgi:hypothetical protein
MKIVLKKYWIFILLFLSNQCTQKKLPSIHINLIEEVGWKTKTKGEFVFSKNPNDTLSGRLKLRGGMSSKYFKHSFSVELDSLFCSDHFPCDDDFVLNANYIDKSFMRHKVSYDLFREMGIDNKAAQSSYIEVFVNNRYEGLYVLMEKVNASFLGVNKKDSMAMVFKDPSVFRTKPFKNSDTVNKYNQRFPKFKESDKAYFLNDFRDFLFDSSDEEFAKNITSWIDLKSVIDWHLLLLLTGNGDGLQKNFYLYKQGVNSPFKIAIWDYDHTFGRDGDNEKNDYKKVMFFDNSIILNRLMKIKETNYKEDLKDRWNALRSNSIISISNITNHIDENYSEIKNVILHNSERWPVKDKWYFDDYTIEEELILMKDYVTFKINSLDTYFVEL